MWFALKESVTKINIRNMFVQNYTTYVVDLPTYVVVLILFISPFFKKPIINSLTRPTSKHIPDHHRYSSYEPNTKPVFML